MRDQWHGMSRTGTVPRLFNLEDEPLLAMHPCDMRHRGLSTGDLTRVSNARGEMKLSDITGKDNPYYGFSDATDAPYFEAFVRSMLTLPKHINQIAKGFYGKDGVYSKKLIRKIWNQPI